MKNIVLDEKQMMELEQIVIDKDLKAAFNFIKNLVEKAKKDEQHRSCDRTAKPF